MRPLSLLSGWVRLTARWQPRAALAALASLICGHATGLAEIIPAERRLEWKAGVTVGVPGGIDQFASRRQVPITGLDATGTADASAIIQNAINSAAPDTCLTLPPGRFRLNSGINVGVKDRITLRGAGPDKTILMLYGGAGVGINAPETHPWNYPNVVLTAKALRGATSFIVNDGSDLVHNAPGLLCQIQPPDDASLPTLHVSGFDHSRKFLVMLRGGTGTTVAFEPALPFDLPAGTRVSRATGDSKRALVSYSGIEDLCVDATNGSAVFSVGISNSYACWLKNVNSISANNYNFTIGFSYRTEMRHCLGSGRKVLGTNGAALLVGQATNCLFEDNILIRNFPSIEINAGSVGNVFGYNFIDQNTVFGVIGGGLNTNHGPHNSFNLYEGNIAPRFQSDGYFGGSSEETLFRNWFHGTAGTKMDSDENRIAITLNRFSRRFNIVGNILGRSGLGISWNYSNVGYKYDTTSSTSNSIAASGSKTFSVEAGLKWNSSGSPVLVYSRSNPSSWMTGECTHYSGTTLTMLVRRSNGSGTHNDWIIVGGSGYGGTYPLIYALGFPNIGNGGIFGDKMVAAPSMGVWWRVWDGRPMIRRGNYNSSTTYNVGDVVDQTAPGPMGTTGGNGILQWIAVNVAKNGRSGWEAPGAGTTDWQPLSSNSFQELDYDVYATLLARGNWNAADNGVPEDRESLGGETLPKSLYQSSKPKFFGALAWPAFDPASPNQSFDAIPAGYRYVHGKEAPGVDDPAAPAEVRISVSVQ